MTQPITEQVLTCPYCGSEAHLKDSAMIYGKSFGMVYLCDRYPFCDSWVGVHKGTTNPLGTMADSELRELRKNAHVLFDRLWRRPQVNINNCLRINFTDMIFHLKKIFLV